MRNVQRHWHIVLLLLLAWPGGARAMDSAGSASGNLEIPEPDMHYRVALTDATGTGTTLRAFTWDGFLHVQGRLGAGTIAIPFDRISRIDMEPSQHKGKVVARIGLATGEVVRLTVSETLTCYGRTDFGNYRIQLKDVKRIELKSKGETPPSRIGPSLDP